MITVTVFSTQTSERKSVNVAPGAKWGDLKAAIAAAGMSTSNMKAMVRSTRVSLEHDAAILPTENFTLLMTPGKVKSGLLMKLVQLFIK